MLTRPGPIVRIATLICAILLISSWANTFAQQSTCTLPVTVVAPTLSDQQKLVLNLVSTPETRELPWMKPWLMKALAAQVDAPSVPVTNLGPEEFLVQDRGHAVPVRSVKLVGGPRRIVFVVENGREMPESARKIEAAVITEILAKARPQDSFALLTARGPRVALGFDSSREAIRAAAEGLATKPARTANAKTALAAVLEATTWFQTPQPGDTIFLLVLRLDKRFDVDFQKVRDAVAAGGIRVAGFQLGLRYGASMEMNSSDVSFEKSFILGEDSGGEVIGENTEGAYRLTSERLDALKHRAGELYKRIAGRAYVLEVDFAGPGLSLGLASPVLRRYPWISVSYPAYRLKCPATLALPRPACTIQVRVVAPDLSKLPKAQADEAVAKWKQALDEGAFQGGGQYWSQPRSPWQGPMLASAEPPKTEIIDELAASDFVAFSKRRPVAIQAVRNFDGPHRIVLVVDNDPKLPPATRNLESAIISNLLSKSRSQDSFALLTAHGPLRELRFDAGRDSLLAATKELGITSKSEPHGKAMLDTLLEATSLLQPPQPGDAILALGSILDSSIRVTYKKVRAATTSGQIRLFWINVTDRIGSFRAAELATESGAWASGMWTFGGRPSPDQQLHELLNDSEEMYMEIYQHYLLDFENFAPHLTIELTPAVQKQHPWSKVRFPEHLPPCSSASAPGHSPPASDAPSN